MSSKGGNHIQVCIKLRPCDHGYPTLWKVIAGRSIQLANKHADPCVVDYVFDESVSNQEVFDRMAQHIVRASMQGFNGTIFAYGQTSSGKTYTMMGDGQNPGVMVLAAKEIFQQIALERDREFLLRVRHFEIYNEKIYDLLNRKNTDLKIHEAGYGNVIVTSEECIITSEDDLLRLLCPDNKERALAEAHIGERSGHSHVILRIIIESRASGRSDTTIQSTLNLVDLAGSERADHTARATDGHINHINKSLMFLSNVIKNLSDNAEHKFTNFRDSKLTRILQASLCGNAFVSIICTIKPSAIEESQSTLNFAMCAKKIRIKPQINEKVSGTMMDRLDRDIEDLEYRIVEQRRREDTQLSIQILEGEIRTRKLRVISSPTHYQMHRSCSYSVIANGRFGAPRPDNPQNSPQPCRPTKLPRLGKPNYLTVEQRRCIASRTIHNLPIGIFQANNRDRKPRVGCHALQARVSDLTASNLVEILKIQVCERVLKKLRQISEVLLMDKAKFNFHVAQILFLEDILLMTLNDRDITIESLQKSLNELSQDVLQNSKQDHIRLMCPDLEASCERLCNMCQELEHMFPFTDAKGIEQLRSEIVATRDKLQSVQSEYCQANCEVIQKTDDCKRSITRQISAVEVLQERCDSLEQQSEGEKVANAKMQADYQAIQQKYQKLYEEYESLARTSNESVHRQKLEADNTRLQIEIGTMKERMEEVQRKLRNSNPGEDFETQNNELLEASPAVELEAQIKELRKLMVAPRGEDFEAQNNELMEAPPAVELEAQNKELMEASPALELEAQNKELKARLAQMQANFDEFQEEYDSLSSQLMDCVQENDTLREELAQRSSLTDDLDSTRTYVVGPAPCEPEYSENDLSQQFADLFESIHQIELKNHLGLSRLFRVDQSQKKLDEKATVFRLCLEPARYVEGDTNDGNHLKGVLKEQMFQLVALSQEELASGEERRHLNIISQLKREIEESKSLEKAQRSSLESEPLETSVQVKKLVKSQSQIEYLEKRHQELKGKALPPSGKTLVAPAKAPVKPSEEVTTLTTTLAKLQSKMEKQSKQMQLKDKNIAKLNAEIKTTSDRCKSQLKEVECDIQEKQKKLSEDAALIHQLQEKNAKLEEELQAKQEQTKSSSEYEKVIEELRKSWRRDKDELKVKEKLKTEEINVLQREFMGKIERSEKEKHAKFLEYTRELQETKVRYESLTATLREQVLQARELQNPKETPLEAEEMQDKMREIEQARASLQDQIRQTEHERDTALNKVEKQEKLIEELKEKTDQLSIYSDNLREEKSILQAKIEKAEAQHSSTLGKLHKLEVQRDEMSKHKVTIGTIGKSDLEEKLETFTAKMSDLEAELQSAKLKATGFDNLTLEHQKLKSSLTEATRLTSNLQEKVDSLESQLLASEKQNSSQYQLRAKLKRALAAKDSASAEQVALTNELQTLKENMSSQARKFEKDIADLNGSLNELQLKLEPLENRRDELEIDNDDLRVKLGKVHNLQIQLAEEQLMCAALRAQFAMLEEANTRLKEQLMSKEADINRRTLEISQKVKLECHSISELTMECAKLRGELEIRTNSFESVHESLHSTISTLLKDKLLLEEKVQALKLNEYRSAELIAQLRSEAREWESLGEADRTKSLSKEQQVEAIVREVERLRTSLKYEENSLEAERERTKATISSLLEDQRYLEEKDDTLAESNFDRQGGVKSIKKSIAERKESRMTVHDENRMQSYLNDIPLSDNLTDSEIADLLMPHSLEAQNELLRTRMVQDQLRADTEQKRLKQKIRNLSNKNGSRTNTQTFDS